MQPPIEPAASAASTKKREMSMPCAPKGGIANFDRTVAPMSGVANMAKRSRSAADVRGDAVLPADCAIAGIAVICLSFVDHGAEQRRSSPLELGLDPGCIGYPG